MSYQTNNLVKEIFDKIFGKYCTFCLKNISTGIYSSYIINSTYFHFTVIFLREEFILVEESFMKFCKIYFKPTLPLMSGQNLNSLIIIALEISVLLAYVLRQQKKLIKNIVIQNFIIVECISSNKWSILG